MACIEKPRYNIAEPRANDHVGGERQYLPAHVNSRRGLVAKIHVLRLYQEDLGSQDFHVFYRWRSTCFRI